MVTSFKRFFLLEETVDPEKSRRHQSMSLDFSKLFIDMKNEGLFKPSYWRVILRIFEPFLFWYIAMHLIRMPNILVQILGCCFFALGSGRGGYRRIFLKFAYGSWNNIVLFLSWLMHEGGHHSLTGNHKLDRIIESVMIGTFLGLSGRWWSRGHNKHHACPQVSNSYK